MLSMLVSLLVTIPLCYAPAAFVAFLVRERACKSKRVSFFYHVKVFLFANLVTSLLVIICDDVTFVGLRCRGMPV